MKKARFHHLDFIRLYLTSLVILHHASIVYGGSGGWYWIEGGTQLSSTIMTLFTAVNQSYFMGTFFLLAGYFAIRSITRHGKAKFLKQRLIRLGIPLLFFNFVISPVVVTLAQQAYGRITGNFFELLWKYYFHYIGSGPLWFTKALLILSLILLLLPNRFFRKREDTDSFRYLKLFIFAVSTSILAFLVRLLVPVGADIWEFQLGYFVQYIYLFFWGATMAHNTDFTDFPASQALPWFITSFLFLICLPLMMFLSSNAGAPLEVFMGGLTWQALAYALWDPFFAIGAIFLVWKISLYFKNIDLKIPVASYGAYIIHPLVIVSVSLIMRPVQLSPFLKFGIVGLSSIVICYSISLLLRSIPGMKNLV